MKLANKIADEIDEKIMNKIREYTPAPQGKLTPELEEIIEEGVRETYRAVIKNLSARRS